MPRILGVIDERGFALRGLHLIPSCAERWTLHVDVDGPTARPQLVALKEELQRVGDIIAVIHNASPARA
jgi:acetolactate synthase regulatory subunit